MAIKKTIDEKLKVKPIFLNLEHEGPHPERAEDLDANSAYEGPCRLGTGEQLTNSYDCRVGREKFKVFQQHLEEDYPEDIEFVNPSYEHWTDSFTYHHEFYEGIKEDLDNSDFFMCEGVLHHYPFMLCAREAKIPSAVIGCCSADYPAGCRPQGMEAYGYIDHSDAARHLRLMRVKKALQKTKVLYILKDCVLAYGAVGYIDPVALDANKDLGVQVRFANLEELRDTIDHLTPEQEKKAEEKADELFNGARNSSMSREMVVRSCRLYVAVLQMLERYECNAFSMPCHEACATRLFNDVLQCTPCLLHSLLKEDGIPSACELDLNALLSIDILMNLTGNAPHMGNSGPYFQPDKGDFTVPNGMPWVPEIEGVDNLCFTFHAVQTRKMKGIKAPNSEYDLVPFTQAGWGATIRHDFNQEKGEVITFVRFSPDAKKMFVVRGEIVAGAGMSDVGCGTGLYWKCANSRDFFNKMQTFGHHMTWTYGDHVEDLKELAQMLNVEVVTA